MSVRKRAAADPPKSKKPSKPSKPSKPGGSRKPAARLSRPAAESVTDRRPPATAPAAVSAAPARASSPPSRAAVLLESATAQLPESGPADPASPADIRAAARAAQPSSSPPPAATAPIPESGPARPASRENPDASLPAALTRLAEHFQLSHDERRVLGLLLHTSAPPPVSQVATALALGLGPLLGLLAGDSPLRAHGLVEVDAAAELGFLRPDDLLYPGRGLHLAGHTADAALFSGQAPGVMYLAAPPPGTEWAKDILQDRSLPAAGQAALTAQATQVTELVRERLIAPHPVLLWLSHCLPETILPLSHAARLRLQRPIVIIDGAALAGWPTPQLFAALRRLRRDADLRGAVVVVSETQLLGGAWAALTAPRPPGQTAPVVLCTSSALAAPAWPQASGRGGAELVPQAATLRPGAAVTTAASAGGAAADPGAEDPATLASREEARRRAALDAARAMGKPIPPELMAAAAASPAPVAPPRPAAPAAPAAPPPPPPPAPRPPAAAPAAPTSAAAPARPTNPRLAAALAKAGLPPAGSGQAASAAAASVPAVAPAAPAAPAAPPTASPPAGDPAGAAAASPAAPADQPTAASEPAVDDPPPLPLADDAALDELLRVCRTTPNQLQRAEILRKLSGKKSPHVIQMFRANVQSAHPGVRAAAEEGMASLFGANWNRTRAIAPPVQPPRSDDGGRGPGGAF